MTRAYHWLTGSSAYVTGGKTRYFQGSIKSVQIRSRALDSSEQGQRSQATVRTPADARADAGVRADKQHGS